MDPGRQWDIFCKVIDNHGDLGVCWRLAVSLARRGQAVRLWVDDASALAWMAPDGQQNVKVMAWDEASNLAQMPLPATEVLVEAFGCDLPERFLEVAVAACGDRPPVWLNLEYLSAEPYVARCHKLPSPVLTGSAAGWTKHFFYPGFTAGTGGLIREQDLAERQAAFNAQAWLAGHGVQTHSGEAFNVSLFCYEPAALTQLLADWAAAGHLGRPVNLLVTPGRAAAAVRACRVTGHGALRLHFLPYLTHTDFDHLLWACDLNLVRGEDSLVRALWSGRPTVWQLYPQDDLAHLAKLDAFLDVSEATAACRAWHRAWNQPLPAEAATGPRPWELSAADWADWQVQARTWRQKLLVQADLASGLLGFVADCS